MAKFKMEISDQEPGERGPIVVNITRLARETGYSISHLSRVFNKETTPSTRCLVHLGKALEITIGELYDRIKEGSIGVAKSS